MCRRLIAILLLLAMPGSVSAGPLKEAADKAARELASSRSQLENRGRGRFWTGIALITAGGVMTALGSVELGDDETGSDDGEDLDGSDDGEDSDGWGNKALLGGGIAAATAGGIMLITGRKSGPSVSARRGRLMVRYTVTF